jgi:copper chaperone CopZ
VRSALLEVKGVTRARATLEQHEAIVTYDPRQATVENLIQAINGAQGPGPYRARVKGP